MAAPDRVCSLDMNVRKLASDFDNKQSVRLSAAGRTKVFDEATLHVCVLSFIFSLLGYSLPYSYVLSSFFENAYKRRLF